MTWTSDMLGQVIARREKDSTSGADPYEIWHRFSGRQMGYVGNNGDYDVDYASSVGQRQNGPTNSFADFDLATDHINSYTQGSRGGMYTVQAGDTLSSIAAQLWGDANLWYKIAEANGLQGDAVLTEGAPLIIPAGVQRNENNATTFKPYDPLEVLGNTSPTAPKPKKAKNCGVVGAIVVQVVAYVVAAIISYYVPYAGTYIGRIITAAASNAVGQAVAVEAGLQERISWNQVALAAISTGVSESPIGNVVAKAVGANGQLTHAAVVGMTNNVVTQGIARATGLQDKFSWAGVAAAGASAVAFQLASDHLPGAAARETRMGPKGPYEVVTREPSRLNLGLSGMAATIANAAARSLLNGGDFGDNMLAALPDVLGQTIGGVIAGGIAGEMAEARLRREQSAIADQLAGAPGADAYGREDLMGAAAIVMQAGPIADDIGADFSPLELAMSDPAALPAFVEADRARRDPRGSVVRSNAAAVELTRVLGGDLAADQVAAALQFMPTDEQLPIIVEGSRQAGAARRGGGLSSGVITDAYNLLQGVGRAGEAINSAIERNPWARFGLLALDVASGPVSFAASTFIMASPLGGAIETGIGAATNWMVDQMRAAGIQDPQGVYYAVSGGVLLGTLALGARRALNFFQSATRHLGALLRYGPRRPGLDIPQGFSPAAFDRMSGRLRAELDRRGLGDDVFVMGSRAGGSAGPDSDLDIGIRVSPGRFDELIADGFRGARNAAARTRDRAIRDGRIQTGEAGLRDLRTMVAQQLGISPAKVQLSIIRSGGLFDNGAQSPLAYGFR